MSAYRLYSVVPELVTFIDNLTNIYVRYNRRRLKGRNGREDTCMALAVLFDTLLVVCKVSIIQLSPRSLLIARLWRTTLTQSKERAELVVATRSWLRSRPSLPRACTKTCGGRCQRTSRKACTFAASLRAQSPTRPTSISIR